VSTLQLLDRTKLALEQFHYVHQDADGALSFRHTEVPWRRSRPWSSPRA